MSQPRSRSRHTYHGHRRYSFIPVDNSELVELRARQRTFDGAYARTAVGCLAYSLTFLKLFDRRFYSIGIVFLALAAMLAVLAFLRGRQAIHDFADEHRPQLSDSADGASRTRVFGRAFVTAGWIVIAVTVAVTVVELALLVLVLRVATDTV